MDKEYDDKQRNTHTVSNSSVASTHEQKLSKIDKECDKIQRNTYTVPNSVHTNKEYDDKQRNTDTVSNSSSTHDRHLSHSDNEYYKMQRNTDSVSRFNSSAPFVQIENRLYVGRREDIQKTKTSSVSNSLAVRKIVTSALFLQDICVRYNQEQCSITGSDILPNSQLVLVDYMNSKIKLVDMRSMRITNALKVARQPWDITFIKKDQVAVTYYNNDKVLILEVTNTIILEREIKVSGQCRGIEYSKNQFVVTYVNPPYIEIMDLFGNVESKIENDKDGNKLFKHPQFVRASSDGNTLYVSDYEAHKVVILSRAGAVKDVYTDTDLKYPMKVCLDNRGNLYVCGSWSRNIHMLTPDCIKIKVILTQTDLTERVYSVSHCSMTDRLFVGMAYCHVVKVYQMSHTAK